MLALTVILIVGSFVATLMSGDRPALGLDLRGGISIVLFPVDGSDLSTLDTAAEIIRSRVDGLGIAEPEVSRQGDTLVVDLPGVKDRARAEKLVGETAELRFRLVEGAIPWSDTPSPSSTSSVPPTTAAVGSTTTAPSSSTTSGKSQGVIGADSDAETIAYRPGQVTDSSTTASTSPTTAPAAPGTTAPAAVANCEEGKLVTPRAQATASATVILPNVERTLCYKLGPTLLTGRNVGEAEAFINPSTAEWAVNVKFRNDDFVTKVAQPYVNKDVAIELDDVVLSAPRINPGITGRDVQISGSFTEREARDLALALRYGALPVQFDSTQQTVQSVSPSLGKDQLRAGIISGLIGLALVALYMLFFYRLLGVVVWIGLALTGMTFFSLTTWLSATQGLTLTLAGVTGIIVSVGVTVDSYVVYFERLKDEARMGKTIRSSLEPGFRRSFRTIVAADLVSLIGAVVLYLLAAGSVRGFAYFLGLSTVLDLILAYTFMQPLVLLLARRPALVRMRGIGIGAALDIPEARA